MPARVASEDGVPHTTPAEGVREHALVPPLESSALSLSVLRLDPGSTVALGDADRDVLLYGFAGLGSLELSEGVAAFPAGSAALVRTGEVTQLQAGSEEIAVLCARIGPEADRHAPLGPVERVVRFDEAGRDRATGARSFQVLFGPHNGSTRGTLFVGFVPPGRAPWHYHLYDEIVWVADGPGRLYVGESVEELGDGSAFRLSPREVHIVENPSSDRELEVLGVFSPAGSPSAAYLPADIAAAYRFAG